MLFGSAFASSAITAINGGVLVVMLWTQVPSLPLVLWYGALLLVSAGRLMLSRRYYQAAPAADESIVWANRFVWGTGLASVLWACASVYLFPPDSVQHQVFLAFVVGGMCAGAVTSLSFLKIPVYIYLTAAMVPLIVQFFLSNSDFALPMAFMGLLFFATISISALRIYSSTVDNITIRFKSEASERALSESESRYRGMVESAPLGIIQFDHEGNILEANPAFEKMLVSAKALEGGNVRQLLQDSQALAAMEQARQVGAAIHTGEMLLPGNPEVLPLRIFFRCGGEFGGLAIVEDLSEDYKVERLKNEFVSTVSHELRTPLTAIKGSLDLLASDVAKGQPQMADDLIDNARRNSNRLLSLINDILDIDKISQGKLEYHIEPTSLMPLIDQVVVANIPYGEQHGVRFVIREGYADVRLEMDGQRIGQVLTNLLSNSAKFSPEGAEVAIWVEDRGSEVCLVVEDHGCGIPEAFRDRIFTKFSQHDGSDVRKVGGTGLGLNISKAIVEHHHGRLEFDSTPGQGTTFYVILPKVQP